MNISTFMNSLQSPDEMFRLVITHQSLFIDYCSDGRTHREWMKLLRASLRDAEHTTAMHAAAGTLDTFQKGEAQKLTHYLHVLSTTKLIRGGVCLNQANEEIAKVLHILVGTELCFINDKYYIMGDEQEQLQKYRDNPETVFPDVVRFKLDLFILMIQLTLWNLFDDEKTGVIFIPSEKVDIVTQLCFSDDCPNNKRHEYPPLKACAACKVVMYCSPECQKRDWRHCHKRKCMGKKGKQLRKEYLSGKLTHFVGRVETLRESADPSATELQITDVRVVETGDREAETEREEKSEK